MRYVTPRWKSARFCAVFHVRKPSTSRVAAVPAYWSEIADPCARSSEMIGPRLRRGTTIVAGGMAPAAGTTVTSSRTPLPGLFWRKTSGIARTASLTPLYVVANPAGEPGSGTISSTYMSVTSVGLFVAPQATRGVWPTRTNGTPAAPMPVALISPPFTAIGYHVDGHPSERCGSFAIIGFPVADSFAETPHSFEPRSLPRFSASLKYGAASTFASQSETRPSTPSALNRRASASAWARKPACAARFSALRTEPVTTGSVVVWSKGSKRARSSKKSFVPSKPAAAPVPWYVRNVWVRPASESSKNCPRRKRFANARLSSAVQGSNFVISSAAYSGGSGWLSAHAFTPAAYASSAARPSFERMFIELDAVRRRPIARSWTSLESAAGPRSSASVPLAWRR